MWDSVPVNPTCGAPPLRKIEIFLDGVVEYSFKQKHKDKNRNGNINNNALCVMWFLKTASCAQVSTIVTKQHAKQLYNHAEILEEERAECAEWGGTLASQVDVVENTDTGTTKLYIEKEIYIIIQRYKVTSPPLP